MFDPIKDLFNSNEDESGTVFRDVIFIMVLAFLAMIIIMVPFLNDPGKKRDEIVKAPGNVIVEMYWDDAVNVDIDGWVQGPSDKMSVGFMNRAGIQFNLLRDDRGTVDDYSNRNYENFFSRGLTEGEYIFNAHWWAGTPPAQGYLDIAVVISVRKNDAAGKGTAKQILAIKIQLKPSEDVTVCRFYLDKHGDLVPDSVDFTYINLKGQHGISNNNGASGDMR